MPTSNDSNRSPSPRQEWDSEVLDALADHDFYASYKSRLRELLAPRPGSRYLDVGAGSGQAARRFCTEYGVDVVAIDRSAAMGRLAAVRGVRHIVVADAHQLPFAARSFDG